MQIMIYVGIGALIAITGRLLFPFFYGIIGYSFFPISIGMRKFRSYLKIHSQSLSERVPDSVVRTLVEKSYRFSKSAPHENIPGLPSDLQLQGNPETGVYLASLATHALWLITCLESNQISKDNHMAFMLIGDDLLSKCGLDTSKLSVT